METLLASVTLVSLMLALAMSFVAWRLLRAEKQRSAARVEALEALAFRGESTAPPAERVSSFAALNVTSGAGVAPHGDREPDWDAALRANTLEDEALDLHGGQPPMNAAPALPERLFDQAPSFGPAGRRWLALGAVCLAGVAGWAVLSALRSPEIVAAVAASRSDGALTNLSGGKPLELLSLRHGSNADGAFTVTGLVQNPADGRDRQDLEAVVYLFDEQGRYFAGGHALVDVPHLERGDESPFVVSIPGVSGVGRYRVAFRAAGGGSVAHVDRRGQTPQGTTGGNLVDDLPLVRPAVAPRPSPGDLAP